QLRDDIRVRAELDADVDVNAAARIPAGEARVKVDAAGLVRRLRAAEVALARRVGVVARAEAGTRRLPRVHAAALRVPDLDDGARCARVRSDDLEREAHGQTDEAVTDVAALCRRRGARTGRGRAYERSRRDRTERIRIARLRGHRGGAAGCPRGRRRPARIP